MLEYRDEMKLQRELEANTDGTAATLSDTQRHLGLSSEDSETKPLHGPNTPKAAEARYHWQCASKQAMMAAFFAKSQRHSPTRTLAADSLHDSTAISKQLAELASSLQRIEHRLDRLEQNT